MMKKINSIENKNSIYNLMIKNYFFYYFDKKTWTNKDEFLNFALEILKIDEENFYKILSTNEMKKYIKFYEEISPIASIYGTPSYLISGKYLINPSAIKSEEDFVEIISDLLNKE